MIRITFRPGLAIIGTVLALVTTVPAQAAPVTITINDNNTCTGTWVSSSNPPTITCTTGAPPPSSGAPTGCTLTVNGQSSLSVVGGTTVTLSAQCATGNPTVFKWTNPSGAGFGTGVSSAPFVVNSNATFSVTPNNGQDGNTATASVTVSGTAPPPSSASCGGYSTLDLGTLPFTNRLTSSGFGNNGMAIATLQVPGGFSRNVNTIAIYEYGGAVTGRRAWLSKTRCDTSATAAPYFIQDTGPVFNYSIGGAAIDIYGQPIVVMQPGETWYLMVRNETSFYGNALKSSCTSGNCDIGITWYPPN